MSTLERDNDGPSNLLEDDFPEQRRSLKTYFDANVGGFSSAETSDTSIANLRVTMIRSTDDEKTYVWRG